MSNPVAATSQPVQLTALTGKEIATLTALLARVVEAG